MGLHQASTSSVRKSGVGQDRILKGPGIWKKMLCTKSVQPISQLQRGTKRPSGKVTRKNPRQKNRKSVWICTNSCSARGILEKSPTSPPDPNKRKLKEANRAT